MVAENKTHGRFWSAQEGADWIVMNEVRNDDYKAERDPMKLSKLENRRQQNQTFESTFPGDNHQHNNPLNINEENKIDIIPELQVDSYQHENQFDESN